LIQKKLQPWLIINATKTTLIMKRKLLFLCLLITALTGFSQNTYVPDDNFEVYLEANGMGNSIPNDNYVTTANISG